MNGIRKGNEVIYITHLPNHKRPVLAIGNGYAIQKIATFDNEEVAEGFCQMLNTWLGLEDTDETAS